VVATLKFTRHGSSSSTIVKFFAMKSQRSSEEQLQHFTTQCNLQETFIVKTFKVLFGDEFVVWN
jgi:hypothetical protein